MNKAEIQLSILDINYLRPFELYQHHIELTENEIIIHVPQTSWGDWSFDFNDLNDLENIISRKLSIDIKFSHLYMKTGKKGISLVFSISKGNKS